VLADIRRTITSRVVALARGHHLVHLVFDELNEIGTRSQQTSRSQPHY
jgi:hypothetical protein